MVEIAPRGREGLAGCLMPAASGIGGILGNVAVMIVTAACTPQQLLVWGWRLPYLVTAFNGGLVSGGQQQGSGQQLQPGRACCAPTNTYTARTPSRRLQLHAVPFSCSHVGEWAVLARCRRCCCG